jgi:hypothetical protein
VVLNSLIGENKKDIMEDERIKNEEVTKSEKSFFDEIIGIIQQGRTKAYRAINNSMLETYWRLGKRIVEQEQQGKERAEYGKGVLKRLSVELNKKFEKGYGERNLRDFRQFYTAFQSTEIWHTPCAKFQNSDNQSIEIHHTLRDILDNESNQQTEIRHTPDAKSQNGDNQSIEILHTACGEFDYSLFSPDFDQCDTQNV